MRPTECPGCGGELPGDLFLCPECSRRLRRVDPPADPLVDATILGKYVIDSLLAEGGMGRVYKGRHRELSRVVAIKVIQPVLSSVPQVRDRFFLEAKALSGLTDPHSVSIVDFGTHTTGELCIVMQFVSGECLSEIIAREGPLPPRRAVNLTLQILGAIAEAHALGILHRDLKPDNIIVQKLHDGSDFAVVLDFGIARLAEQPGGARATAAGVMIGTPRYMSPEQAFREEVGAASDLYSMGLMLYEMLTRTLPCYADDVMSIVQARAQAAPPVQSRPSFTGDGKLALIVNRLLERQPSERYPTALDTVQALRDWLSGSAAGAECVSCGTPFDIGARFCPQCGMQRALPEAAPATADEAPIVDAAAARMERPAAEFALVGRESELATITELCARPARMRLVITGAAGLGKGRMLEEVVGLLGERGLRTIVVGPDPIGRARLGGAMRRLVCGVLMIEERCSYDVFHAAGLRVALPEPDIGALAFLCGLGTPAGMAHADDTTESLKWLSRVASEQRTAIVCRDLDRFDALSRRAFEAMLGAAPEGLPIAVTAAAAPSGQWSVVPLEPMTDGAAAELASIALRKGGDPTAAARVVALGKGIPLALIEAAALERDGGQLGAGGYADIVAARLRRLDVKALSLLRRAAVLGEVAAPEAGSELAPALAGLAQGRFLTEHNGRWRFAHMTTQEVVYATVPAEVRRRLHVEAAELAESDPEQGAWVMAAHCSKAGNARRAVEAWMAAAHQARSAGDFALEGFALREALTHIRLAERLDEVTETAYVDKFADISLLLATAAVGTGDTLGAVGLLREALSLPLAKETAARLWLRLGEVQASAGNRVEASSSIDRAKALAKRGKDVRFDAELAVLIAEITSPLLGIVEAIQRFVDTLGAPEHDPLADTWQLAARLGKVYEDAGDRHSARAYNELALGAATRAGDTIGRASAYTALMRVHGQSGEYDAARRTGEQAVEILSQVGDRRRTKNTLMELRKIAKLSDNTGAFKLEVDQRARTLATALGFVWMPESGAARRG